MIFVSERSGNFSIMDENATVSDYNGMDCRLLKGKSMVSIHKPDLIKYPSFKTEENVYYEFAQIPTFCRPPPEIPTFLASTT